jgi:hypothetical protein
MTAQLLYGRYLKEFSKTGLKEKVQELIQGEVPALVVKRLVSGTAGTNDSYFGVPIKKFLKPSAAILTEPGCCFAYGFSYDIQKEATTAYVGITHWPPFDRKSAESRGTKKKGVARARNISKSLFKVFPANKITGAGYLGHSEHWAVYKKIPDPEEITLATLVSTFVSEFEAFRKMVPFEIETIGS